MIRVVVCGSGNMGSHVLATVEAQDDLEPVGIIEPLGEAGERIADSQTVYAMHPDPAALFARAQPDVVVDFTNAAFTTTLVDAALEHGVRPVIGTSSVPDAVIERLRAGLAERRLGGVLAPNFALGAVVLMHLAKIAAPHFDAVEVIELHHDRKVDYSSSLIRRSSSSRGRSAATVYEGSSSATRRPSVMSRISLRMPTGSTPCASLCAV